MKMRVKPIRRQLAGDLSMCFDIISRSASNLHFGIIDAQMPWKLTVVGGLTI
jgi:regulator of RNase E activity RraB